MLRDVTTTIEAIKFSREWERANGIPSEGGFFNLGRREGLKLAFLEAMDDIGGGFDWYLQGVSTAMGAYGAYKGALQYLRLGKIDHLPKLGLIQEHTCCPQVRAFREGCPEIQPHHIIRNPDGIADATLKGDPSDTYPYMYEVVRTCGGVFESVTAEVVLEARRQIFELEGVPACNASSRTIAGLKKLVAAGTVGPDERILANITGSDRDPALHTRQYTEVVRRQDGSWAVKGDGVMSHEQSSATGEIEAR